MFFCYIKFAIVHSFSSTKCPHNTKEVNSDPTIISFVSRALLARQIFNEQSLSQKLQQNTWCRLVI